MESIKNRFTAVNSSLARLKDDLDILASKNDIRTKYYRQFRNSAIQSFEFSADTLWKFMKEYLNYKYEITIESPTPRAIFRECSLVGLITSDEFQNISDVIADRNLTSHTYNEILAEEIAQRLLQYYNLMQEIIKRIEL